MNLLQILKNSANILYAKYIKGDDLEKLPIFYIGGSQTLPPPLAPEEEEKAIQKLANGSFMKHGLFTYYQTISPQNTS